MDFNDIMQANAGGTEPFLIAGPCSAESEQQLLQTAMELSATGIKVLRAGLWKPRTRPGHFEGVGERGLTWMQHVREVTGMVMATEVATAAHVKACVKAGVEILWIGTRTSGNPFSMAELSKALADAPDDQIVLIKNPLCPGIDTWLGAIERIQESGLKNIGVIHRGFADFSDSVYRNPPHWEEAHKLRAEMPGMPMIIDPSHMAGKTALIPGLMCQAVNLGFNAFMIESHNHPTMALSDSKQQLTPEELKKMLDEIFPSRKALPDISTFACES